MKNLRENTVIGAKFVLLGAAVLYCICCTGEVKAAASEAAKRCIFVLIPSLYAMLALSGIIMQSGITGHLPKAVTAVGKFLFGMTGSEFAVFLLSLFAGYPVGAKLLCSGNIEKRRAELLCGVCFGAGPAFIFGCIAGELYGSDAAGRVIMLSTVGANVLTAFALSAFLGRERPCEVKAPPPQINAKMLSDAVTGGGRALAGVCCAVLAFSVIGSAAERFGAASAAGALISRAAGLSEHDGEVLFKGFLDVTALGELTCGDYTLLPWISALTAFGGLCVMFQISAVVSGNLSIKPLVLARLAAAVMSFLLCKVLMPLMLSGETVAVSTVKVRSFRAQSPVPSLMLIVMTLMLIASAEERKRRK